MDPQNKLHDEHYLLLLNSAAEGIYQIDTHGNCLFCNKAALKMLGYQELEDVLGRNMHDLIHHMHEDGTAFPVEKCKIFQAFIDGTEQHVVDEVLWTKEGISFPAEYWSYPIFSEGKIMGSVVTFVDITARKEIEVSLKESEARLHELNATKDKFFSIISHDLRSPFNTILGFCDLLLMKAKTNDYKGMESYASIIRNSSQNTLNLLTNLLDWSRSQTNRIALNPEHFEMGSLINEIIDFFYETANQKQISFVKILPLDTEVYADRHMIATVARNLISNAIKYTNVSGKITVCVIMESNEVTVEVIDNGVGIKKEKINNLFRIDQSFSTQGTKNEKGTGLGLLLCKEFVDKHGGLIRVKSEIDKGSTFSFTIPLVESKANSSKTFELEEY